MTTDAVGTAGVSGAMRERFAGPLLEPDDEGYDQARRIWNGSIDRRPALIARCTGTADVIEAVRFARERDLLVSVRAGGHNVAGTAVCDGGLMIDLSLMKGSRVDPNGRRAQAQPGLLLGEFDHETQAFGLAAPAGIVTHTGLAGLTLGGGIGWLMRKHGLTCDAVRSMDVVTADGEFVRASEDENHDLYWGLRGGGGNFGIVTSFELDVYPIGPTVTAGFAFYPAEEAPKVLAFVRDFAAEAPEEVTLIVALRNAPAAPYVPESIRGQPVVAVGVCYAGDPERGMRELAPLEEFGPPSVDLIEPKPFRAHQSTLDQGVPNGLAYYWKSHYLDDLTDDVVRVLVERSWPTPTAMSYTLLFQMGGAIRRLGEDDTAFSGRAAGYAININSVAAEGEDQAVPIEWCREYFKALEPHAVGVYMNFLDQEGHERVVSAYGQEKFDRLRALKDRYDPTNFFRMNQNIPPTGH